MIFLIRRYILLIVVAIVVLMYAGIELPYIKEFGELIGSLLARIDLHGIVTVVQDALGNVRKAL